MIFAYIATSLENKKKKIALGVPQEIPVRLKKKTRWLYKKPQNEKKNGIDSLKF
jgi:hypothetical protein